MSGESVKQDPVPNLAEGLLAFLAFGRVDIPYRLARIVARVWVSPHLR